jgi:hypothetical protein
MTHCQAQDFPDTSQVLLHKNNKNQRTYIIRDAKNDVPVTVAFQFVSECTVCMSS